MISIGTVTIISNGPSFTKCPLRFTEVPFKTLVDSNLKHV